MPGNYILKYPNRNVYQIDQNDASITRLTITRNNGDQYTVVIDTDDLPKIRRRKWRTSHQRLGRVEAVTGLSYDMLGLGRYLMAPEHDQVVHFINGDPLDCRRQNMVLTVRPDIPNQGRPNGCSGEKHVYWRHDQTLRPWQVVFKKTGKPVIVVGSYATVSEAVQARDEYLKKNPKKTFKGAA